jgi:4,5-dihydroxyphthalate decarboxylase
MSTITLTCADYARVMPLVTGQVRAEGLDLRVEVSRDGSWAGRAEMLRRALQDPAVQGGEQSMAGHLLRIDRGDRSHVALPIFPLRNFTARDLYVRRGGSIRSAADLDGARIGIYGWANSGSVWYRHFLRYLGVDLAKLRWWVGPVDEPRPSSVAAALPEGVQQPPAGQSLSDMLLADDLDAIYSPPRPAHYHPVHGPIARLFPDFRPMEEEYFRKTGAFPPQHLIVLRRAAWEADPSIAGKITDAFTRCTEAFGRSQKGFPYATPWLEAELEATESLMGPDFHAEGLDANRRQLEMFCEMAHTAGLTSRLVTIEDYFEEYLKG